MNIFSFLLNNELAFATEFPNYFYRLSNKWIPDNGIDMERLRIYK